MSHTTWRIAILTFLGTALGVLLVANLTLGDKVIDETVPSLYTVADPQFARTMSVMLGPALLPGNRTDISEHGVHHFHGLVLTALGEKPA